LDSLEPVLLTEHSSVTGSPETD